MIKETKEYIIKNNMIKQNDTVIAAVSGGADSVCLLVVLDELRQDLRFKLEAVHVEHGIRGDRRPRGIQSEDIPAVCCKNAGDSRKILIRSRR